MIQLWNIVIAYISLGMWTFKFYPWQHLHLLKKQKYILTCDHSCERLIARAASHFANNWICRKLSFEVSMIFNLASPSQVKCQWPGDMLNQHTQVANTAGVSNDETAEVSIKTYYDIYTYVCHRRKNIETKKKKLFWQLHIIMLHKPIVSHDNRVRLQSITTLKMQVSCINIRHKFVHHCACRCPST